MESKTRTVEEFFLMKIEAGVLIEKNGQVYNCITRNTYKSPNITLHNKDFKNHVAVLSSTRVMWMIKNRKLIPQNTMIKKSNGQLKEFSLDSSSRDFSSVGRKRKITEKRSEKAIIKFVNNIHNISDIKEFCKNEKLNFSTFNRDIHLLNDLTSMDESNKHLIEGVFKFYKKVKKMPSGVGFKRAHELRVEYSRNPVRVGEFAKTHDMNKKLVHDILENKTRFIDGYIHEDEIINAKTNFYESIKTSKLMQAELIRQEYIDNPCRINVFEDLMMQKYDIKRYRIPLILNNKIHTDGELAKKCLRVKNKRKSDIKKSKNNGRNIR